MSSINSSTDDNDDVVVDVVDVNVDVGVDVDDDVVVIDNKSTCDGSSSLSVRTSHSAMPHAMTKRNDANAG